jgi:hypothetical protein
MGQQRAAEVFKWDSKELNNKHYFVLIFRYAAQTVHYCHMPQQKFILFG